MARAALSPAAVPVPLPVPAAEPAGTRAPVPASPPTPAALAAPAAVPEAARATEPETATVPATAVPATTPPPLPAIAVPTPQVSTAPGGDVAGTGPGTGGGTGGGEGKGRGTGTGDGTGRGKGGGSGGGAGTGTGSGSGSDVAILDGPRPPYPPMALRARWEGVVVLDVLVAPDGSAASVTVHATSGRPVLDDAAVRAVKRWRFAPATKEGDAIPRQTELAVRFQLDETM